MNTENIQNERELLCELYSFTASNGEIYFIKPATLKDVINPESTFTRDIRYVSSLFSSENGNEKTYCHIMLMSEDNVLRRLFEKYVCCNGKLVVFDELVEKDTLTVDDIIEIVKRLAGISGMDKPKSEKEENDNNTEINDDNGNNFTMLFASLMKDRTMEYEEIFNHSIPFLSAISKQINRIRIIEAGGNPDKTNDENDGNDENKVFSTSKNKNYIEEESTLSDADFYGQLNSLLG